MSSLKRKLFVFLELASIQLAALCFIANLTTVNKTRLETGIKGDLDSKAFVLVRRSDRLGSRTQKRQFDNLEGLTSPRKRKRKPSKKATTSVNEETAVETPAEADEHSADAAAEDTAVGTLAAVDETSADAAAAVVDETGPDAAAEDIAVGTPAVVDETSADVAAAVVDETGPDAAAEAATIGTPSEHLGEDLGKFDSGESAASVSSEVMTDSLQSLSQSATLWPRTPGSITDSSSPESFSTAENAQLGVQPKPLLSCPLSTMSDLLNPEDAKRVVTSVLLYCANQHHKIGKFGRQYADTRSTTDIAKIRALTKQVAGLDYEAAARSIAKRKAVHVGDGLQNDNDENVYWEVILKGAKLLDPATLPAAKGPYDGFSVAEKIATYNFSEIAGLGTSSESQRQYRGFWKVLFDIRKAGVEKITCYRTAEFDNYCKTYPKRSDISLVDTIVSWERLYGPQIDQLEGRVFEQRKGDLSGRSRLKQKHVTERLDVAESSWNDASNEWYSSDEEAAFKLTTAINATSSKSLSSLFNDRANTEQCWNKAIFISLVPNGDKLLTLCPVIPVFPGDFLGVFSGKVRFTEQVKITQAISGPTTGLWLDYSQVSGTLNQMQVAKPGGDSNVRLEWEAVNEMDETGPCVSWRVLVLATKEIMPLEQLIRAAPRNDQFLLHQRPEFAKRGFLSKAVCINASMEA